MKRAFRPEFLNRVDDIIVFHSLSKEDITAIVRMMVARINAQLADKSIRIEPTEAALELLVQKGFDATYGARQLRRTLQKHVEDPLAEAIVRGQFGDGARIEVDAEGENFVFRAIETAEPRSRWRSTDRRTQSTAQGSAHFVTRAGRAFLSIFFALLLLAAGVAAAQRQRHQPRAAGTRADVIKDSRCKGIGGSRKR